MYSLLIKRMTKTVVLVCTCIVFILVVLLYMNWGQRQTTWIRHSSISGRGVFAMKTFAPGEVIEVCPTVKSDEWGSPASDYVFSSPDGGRVMALGHGSLYNHQDDPNATYEVVSAKSKSKSIDTDPEDEYEMVVRAVRKIHRGDEIFITYGSEWWTDRGIEPLKLN
jgi:hypothetical protein